MEIKIEEVKYEFDDNVDLYLFKSDKDEICFQISKGQEETQTILLDKSQCRELGKALQFLAELDD